MKDNFSNASDQYAIYRPDYPQSIFDFLYPLLREKNAAWDCGTGNGQIARELAKEFKNVEGTDISQSQLDHAFQQDNIRYSVQPAERTNFSNSSFDLITVAQAIHWFDFDSFYDEVRRVAKPNGLIAIIGYELNSISPEVDKIVRDFYNDVVGNYWDAERRYIQEKYQTIPFPFKELETPEINNIKLWRLEHLIGYLNTWSAVKHFIKINDYNPVDALTPDLIKAWGSVDIRKVNFPILFRAGRIR